MRTPIALVFAAVFVSCGPTERDEAQALVHAVRSIEVSRIRSDQIASLLGIPLRSTDLRRTRDLCADAHENLLRATAEQDRSDATLTRLEEAQRAATLAQDNALQGIEDATLRLGTAMKLLSDANRSLRRCHQQIHAIAVRFEVEPR